jgi:FkbM family methyltransferase
MNKKLKLLFLKIIRFYKTIKSKWTNKPLLVSKRMEFQGTFKTKTYDNKYFYLYNAPFYLETEIFWQGGIDNYEWEYMTRRIWTHLCKQSNTIFDIGSNSGLFATLAKVYNLGSKVVAFEPQPNVYGVLKRNNEVNKFDIVCENCALSNEDGIIPFYNYGNNTFSTHNTTAGSLNKSWRPDNQTSIDVSVMQLDSYLIEKNIKKIDLIKIDVETFEYEVLLGYKENLPKHKPMIILEIQDDTIAKNITSLFNDEDYLYYNIDDEKGLKKLKMLETQGDNRNFLLIPASKCYLLADFQFMEDFNVN